MGDTNRKTTENICSSTNTNANECTNTETARYKHGSTLPYFHTYKYLPAGYTLFAFQKEVLWVTQGCRVYKIIFTEYSIAANLHTVQLKISSIIFALWHFFNTRLLLTKANYC